VTDSPAATFRKTLS